MDRWAGAERVRALAREAGFELAGIATLAPAATAAAYRRWLDRGDHAGMAWMARNVEVRSDARRLLPGARSALVVAAPYRGRETPADETGSIWPRVARYAHGGDYHDALRARLEPVAEAIRALFPGAATRVCVDTAPLLERELAARAGIGAVGKNTNLLHPRLGSWFVLAEILTSVELAPDAPVADLCGECSRCLDACPTAALPAPYRLDATRCLSYWTIEHRGPIPEELRPHLRDWVFGCDVCQQVCPWNRDEAAGDGGEARPRPAPLDLAGLLSIDEEECRDRFRGTALLRARREGLRRNAALALAGTRDPAGLRALERAAGDPSPVVAEAAAWSRARSGPGD